MTAVIELLDKEKAIELLKVAVAERGEDYRYRAPFSSTPQCVYVKGYENAYDYESGTYVWSGKSEGPGCLIGLALIRAGIAEETFIQLDKNNSDSSELLDVLNATKYIGTVTEDAYRIFAAAQAAQDSGQTWGEALSKALEEDE